MGKKSREKRERKLKQEDIQFSPNGALQDTDLFFGEKFSYSLQSNKYDKCLNAMRFFFSQYNRLDVAIALNATELWPANIGSPIKHILAWRILLELPIDSEEKKAITSYAEFKVFAEALYQAWPEFPMLEDFCPEADWGSIKVSLGKNFVPMFYGSCIERTPDFVEAFRITYSDVPEALAHMDTVITLQARIIESIKCAQGSLEDGAECAHVEVPSEEFWFECRVGILQIGSDITVWPNKTAHKLETSLGGFKAPLDCSAFSDAVMQGEALPFIAVEIDNLKIPLSVRNSPSVVIDHWAKRYDIKVSDRTHRSLAQFVSERFTGTILGPITLYFDNTALEDLPVSCILPAKSRTYLICVCDHASYELLARSAKDTYEKVKQGVSLRFRLADGRGFMLSESGANADEIEIEIVIVLTQGNTALGIIDAPEIPTRLLPMADFITIFDSLNEPGELEKYWEFVDVNRKNLSPFSSGAADLLGSFKDSHGVLIEGATSPDMIYMDPSWGTSSRFKTLAAFWDVAPDVFPDNTRAWNLSKGTCGVVVLQSRSQRVITYSTVVNNCTTQTLVEITPNIQFEDYRMLDLFSQLLADCFYRCQSLMSDIGLFHQKNILFLCDIAPSCSVSVDKEIKLIDDFEHVIIDVQQHANRKNLFYLHVDTQAVCAGLYNSKDGSFEVRCLIETIAKCCSYSGLDFPADFADRLNSIALERARYHLQLANRNVDVPDYAIPVVPSSANYKLARKRLATEIMNIGLEPGSYELADAKAIIDPASTQLRLHIENRLASLDRHQRLQVFIQQHDALLLTERTRILRARQSLDHDVEYDRFEAIEKAHKEFGGTARHYRYLLEKTASSSTSGSEQVSEDVLRELIGLVDWFMVLTNASDALHNEIDVGGVVIDDFYIPEVFYSNDHGEREAKFARLDAKSRLGVGINDKDIVEGPIEQLLSSEPLKAAFKADLGFDYKKMLTALVILSQAQRYGFGNVLSLSYASTSDRIIQALIENIEELENEEAAKIVEFLTLSKEKIRWLPGRDVEEADVPYWEHRKRIHRYTIRPLITDGTGLLWGAEAASRALNIWMSVVRDGYLPADFNWPHVDPVIRKIKQGIEKQLEVCTEEIFLRYTPYVKGGIDFFRKFRRDQFEDVGDFDVFAYWPELDLLITVECKYNQPPHTMKDSRRLRDKIYGKSESDKNGQISRIVRRRAFIEKNFSRLLELLKWPKLSGRSYKHVELYVSRDVYYCMIHPPYPVSTQFVAVDTLDTWLKAEINPLWCENV